MVSDVARAGLSLGVVRSDVGKESAGEGRRVKSRSKAWSIVNGEW